MNGGSYDRRSSIVTSLLLASSFFQPSLRQSTKRVNPAVPEKRPIPSLLLALRGMAFHDQDFFLIARRLRQNLACGVRYKRISPKLDARIALFRLAFISNAIHHGHVASIRDRVRPLNSDPGIKLRVSIAGLFMRMPPDACGIKNHVGALHRRQA